jgi:pimeloyl-ACP methyl ester carboxylesterase
VLLHGLTATRRYVLQGSSLLSRRGQRLISYDARGHGESCPAPQKTGYEYTDLVGDLRHVLDALGLEHPVLVGSSMGAATALALALEEPGRVSALVLITPAFDGSPRRDPSELERWDGLADALADEDLDTFLERSGIDAVPERFRDTVLVAVRQRLERHERLGAVADAVRVVSRSRAFEGLDGLDELDLPVLVVGSRDDTDPGHPLAVAEEYARRLPQARLLVEEPGEAPLAWRGSSLSKAIAEFLGTD